MFFGSDSAILRGWDELRAMRLVGLTSPFVVLGPSGARQIVFSDCRADPRAMSVPLTADPVADLLVVGAAYRRHTITRPRVYRLMFRSTSAHA